MQLSDYFGANVWAAIELVESQCSPNLSISVGKSIIFTL